MFEEEDDAPPETPPELDDDAVDAHVAEGKPVESPRLQKRLQKLAAERKELRATNETMTAELAALREKAAGGDATAADLAKLRAELDAERAERMSERELVSAGLHDEEGQRVARALFGAVPEADRPKTIGAWLGSFGEGKPAPRGLAAYLTTPRQAPPKAGGGSEPPPVGGEVTRAALAKANQDMQNRVPGAAARLQALLAVRR